MMHAKVAIFDHNYAVMGSANIDVRSLFLNFELAIYLYSKDDIDTISDWFNNLQSHSIEQSLERTTLSDFSEGLGRMLSPLV